MELSLSNRVTSMKLSATLGMAQAARDLADAGVHVVVMSAGEPEFATPAVISEVAKRSIDQGKTHYVPVAGTKNMIAAMREKFLRDQKVAFAADEVMCTTGAKSAILLALEATINSGDEVIIFAPFWVSYVEQIKLLGGVPVIVHCQEKHDFMPTKEDLAAALTKKTKALILNSPNNPSGGVITKEQLASLASVVQGTNIWIISDEIYEKLIFEGEHFSPAALSSDMRERTIVISGVSKAYAMTGWRVGVVAGCKKIISAMVKLQGQQTTCLPEFIQDAAAFALQEGVEVKASIDEMVSAYKERRDLAVKLFNALPHVKIFVPKGAFYIWADFSYYINKKLRDSVVIDDIDFATRMLKEAHVASVPGSPFGSQGFLRFSIASPVKDIELAAKRIGEWLRVP